jgi:hypothetical protein
MKKLFFVLLLISACLFIASYASADPRMETNKNFCHFILDPDNTDKEVFAAGCNSTITVTEKIAAAGASGPTCETNYIATGYAHRTETVPVAAAPIPPGTTLVLTSNDSDTPCTMVESNGRAYQSHNWQSTIKVEAASTTGGGGTGGGNGGSARGTKGTVQATNEVVKVHYELFCQPDVQ